jgi:hypothetical protein
MSGCTHVISRGKNVGKVCGKPRCKLHFKNDKCAGDGEEVDWSVLQAVLNHIIGNVPGRQACRTLIHLQMASKHTRELVQEHVKLAYVAKLTPDKTRDEVMESVGLSIAQRVELMTGCGCQRCGQPRITKISWPFPIRVCRACLRAITLTERGVAYYGVEYRSEFRLTLRGSTKPVYWRYHVEKELGKPLEHFLMDDAKFAIANDMCVDYKDLINVSFHFRTANHVMKSVVEAEYYVHLAKKLYTDNFGTMNVWNDPVVTPDYIRLPRTVKTKYEYDVLAAEFDVRVLRYQKLRHLKVLGTRSKAVLEKHAFFRDMSWRCIDHPLVLACIQLERDVDNVSLETLEGACTQCMSHVNHVVNSHVSNPAHPTWIEDDPTAKDIFRRLARYPNLQPPLSLFCTAYLYHKGMDADTVTALSRPHLGLESWEDAKKLVEDCNRMHTCPMCRQGHQHDLDKEYSFADLAVHKRYRHEQAHEHALLLDASSFPSIADMLMSALPSFLNKTDVHIYELMVKIIMFSSGVAEAGKSMILAQVPSRYRVWVHLCARALGLHSVSTPRRRKYLKDIEVQKPLVNH